MPKHPPKMMTVLIISGITVLYMMQMGVSPVLSLVAAEFHLTHDALINLAVDMVFPGIILGCLFGERLLAKISIYSLYCVALAAAALGLSFNLWADSFVVYLMGRLLFGIGFGLGVPFIGAAIMVWYPPHQRETMDTVNALFPFLANLIIFSIMAPLSRLLPNGWRGASTLWGVAALLILALWWITVSQKRLPSYAPKTEKKEQGILRALLHMRSFRLLCITFVCDFCCYSYVGIVLPTLLYEAGSAAESTANLLAALVFPAIGIVGCALGGRGMRRWGRRKPFLLAGQIIKLTGLITAAVCGQFSFAILLLGVAIYGFGNGFWIPAMYCVPMELEGMTAAKVGSAFALMTAVAVAFGFLAPTAGGLLTTLFAGLAPAGVASAHVFGLCRSLFAFGLLNLPGIICMAQIPETGKGTFIGKQSAQ